MDELVVIDRVDGLMVTLPLRPLLKPRVLGFYVFPPPEPFDVHTVLGGGSKGALVALGCLAL